MPEPQNSGHEPGLVVFLQPPDIQPQGTLGRRESPGEQGALWFGWCPAGGAREFLAASLTRLSARPGRQEAPLTPAQLSVGFSFCKIVCS